MGSNKFNRALGHLKSTSIDEKIRLLDEQPTNNTTQIYIDEPDTTTTITLNPNLNPVDLTVGDTYATRRDTSGLFMPDGTILTEEPPGDTSYILGPMAAMYYTWSYPWTMIGYIRQSDRRMVNLARVNGKLSDWDGSSGFNSYGQLTLEQAVWFRDIQKQSGATNDPSTYNYYAYYPGPPSQTPDAFGRYPCVITGISKNRSSTTGNPATNSAKGVNPEWGLSGYMFIKNEKTGKWEKKYYYNDGTTSSERSGEMTPDNPFYDAYQRGGGDQAAENGYSRDEIIRAGNEQIQREVDQQAQQDYQDTLRNMSDKPLTIDDFRSAADYSAYKNGGGDAARLQGKSVEEIINQGIQNINQYDQDPRISDRMRQDAQRVAPDTYDGGLENPNLLGRLFRSVTDSVRYAGDKVVKGLPGAIEYVKDWSGGGKKLVDKLFGSSENAERLLGSDWYNTDYATPTSTLRRGELNVSRMYQDTNELTRGTPFGPKDGNYWIGDAPTQGKRGIKNPFASTVSRGWTGTPEVQISTKGGGLPMTKASADDIARLATQGSKTSNALSRLVPFVSIASASADVGIRLNQGDIPGAVLGGASAIPGPAGWLAFGAQVLYDLEKAPKTPRDPNQSDAGTSSPTSGLSGFEKDTGKPQPDAYGGSGGGGLNFSRSQFDARKAAMRSSQMKEAVEPKKYDKDKVVKYLKSQDKDQYIRQLMVALMATGVPASVIKLVTKTFYGKKLTSDEEKFAKVSLPKILKVLHQNRDKTNIEESRQVFIESRRKRILREIKNDVVLPDEKKEKLTGYRPKTFGKLHAQYDKLMQKAENPATFKPMDETAWTKQDKYYNARLSQERKNEVLDHLGTGDHFWEILTETGRKRGEDELKEKYGDFTLVRKEQLAGDTLLFLVDENGKKETILQSEYSDRIARQIEEPLWEQETLNAPNDPLIKRVRNKLATQIDYPDKPSRMGYPDGPTPQQIDGWHPEYGKRAAYYNALDPQSADSMPATGDPETDQKVFSQKTPLKPVKQVYKKKGKPNS